MSRAIEVKKRAIIKINKCANEVKDFSIEVMNRANEVTNHAIEVKKSANKLTNYTVYAWTPIIY